MGAGVEMSDQEIAFKCNFAFIDDDSDIVKW
jgi:2,3-bisphosphoglycerate-independent phosphoglycerate mutase